MATTDQTPSSDNQSGEEQKSQASDLETRLADMQKQLKEAQGEARKHQARADRLEQKIFQPTVPAGRVVQPTTPPARPVQPRSAPSTTLSEAAMENQRELVLLREMIKRGLTEEEVEGIEFNDAAELRIKLDLLQTKKEIEALKAQLEQSSEEAKKAPASTVKVDTGGASGDVQDKRIKRAQTLREQALELKKRGQYQEATWVALRAAQNDPGKVIVAAAEEESD